MRIQPPTSRQIKAAMGVLAYYAAMLGPSQDHETKKCVLAIEFLEGEHAVKQESERIARNERGAGRGQRFRRRDEFGQRVRAIIEGAGDRLVNR